MYIYLLVLFLDGSNILAQVAEMKSEQQCEYVAERLYADMLKADLNTRIICFTADQQINPDEGIELDSLDGWNP